MSLSAILGRAVLGRLLLARGADGGVGIHVSGFPPAFATASSSGPLGVAGALELSGTASIPRGNGVAIASRGPSGSASSERPS